MLKWRKVKLIKCLYRITMKIGKNLYILFNHCVVSTKTCVDRNITTPLSFRHLNSYEFFKIIS